MRDGLVFDAEAGGEDDPAKRDTAYCGDALRQIEAAAGVRGFRQFAGIRSLDSRFSSCCESAADSFLKDSGGVQFFPRLGEQGRLEKAPAGSNQQQK